MLHIALAFSPHRLMALRVPVSIGHEDMEAHAHRLKLIAWSPV